MPVHFDSECVLIPDSPKIRSLSSWKRSLNDHLSLRRPRQSSARSPRSVSASPPSPSCLVTVPLRPCCTACQLATDAARLEGDAWTEHFSRAALIRRRLSAETARPRTLTYDAAPMNVDEVDKRRRTSDSHTPPPPPSLGDDVPSSPRRPPPLTIDTSGLSSPIVDDDEDDEDELFPLPTPTPSPRRTPTASAEPSPSGSLASLQTSQSPQIGCSPGSTEAEKTGGRSPSPDMLGGLASIAGRRPNATVSGTTAPSKRTLKISLGSPRQLLATVIRGVGAVGTSSGGFGV